MKTPITSFLLAALTAAAPAALAVTTARSEMTLAPAACQPALPLYATQIRTRPMAAQNEGTKDAFVTCGMRGVLNNVRYIQQAGVMLRNNSARSISVRCTLVDAGVDLNTPTYYTRTVQLAANSAGTQIVWTAALHNSGLSFRYPAVSCLLPPGAGISGVTRRYMEEVGQ